MPKESRKTGKAILGKKLGMTQIFTEEGQWVPVTVLQAGPCVVLQVRTTDKDGYEAVQVGFDDTPKKQRQPQQARYDKLGVAAKRFVKELPFVDAADVVTSGAAEGDSSGDDVAESGVAASDAGAVVPGAQFTVAAFKEVEHVDVRGVTKGRGFSGTIKRHGFSAGDHSHGSKNVREPGSTGMHTDPGRVIKGKKMSGQYGNAQRKLRNLKVVGIEEADNLLLVKGAVPGHNGGYVYIEESLSS